MFSPSFSPHNPNELYVASDMSGLFHTTDLGASWEIVHFRRFQGYSSARVQFTDDPDVLYCLDHSRYTPRPVKSLDRGNTWQPLDEDPTSRGPIHLFADPADANRLIVSDKCNLYISNDGGNSFERRLSSGCDDGGLHIGGAFFDGDSAFIGTSAGLFVSTDSGESFARSEVPGIPEGKKIVSFSGAREGNTVRLYALVRSENVWAGMIATDLFRSHQEVTPEVICAPFDPNGALFSKGRYHLFYIFQNEKGHCWGHVSSRDLVHWRHHPVGLAPEPGDVDTGILSGGAFVDQKGVPTITYWGLGEDAGICMATSTDDDLDRWTKSPHNPVIPHTRPGDPGHGIYNVADPSACWFHEGRYTHLGCNFAFLEARHLRHTLLAKAK